MDISYSVEHFTTLPATMLVAADDPIRLKVDNILNYMEEMESVFHLFS